MLYTRAAPPNRAAAPIAPVFIGIAALASLVVDAVSCSCSPPGVDVGVGTPLVNGISLAEEAPPKAGS